MILAPHPYKIQLLTNHEERLIDTRSDPREINYNTGLTVRLNAQYHPKERGRLVHTEWCSQDEDGEFTDVVLDVKAVYEDRPDGRALKRTTSRRYMMVNGEWGPHIKVSPKPYDERMANREGVRRRTNIVNDLRDQSTLFGAKEQFRIMSREIDLDIRSYQEEGDLTLINSIAAYGVDASSGSVEDKGQWLEVQPPGFPVNLRQLIMGALSQ